MPSKADSRTKIGIVSVGNGTIVRTNGTTINFFKIDPFNLAVLSDENIEAKIMSFKNLLQALGEMKYQIVCLDDRENYSINRAFLRDRATKENNPAIRQMIEQDEDYIKTIEADASAARLFLLAVEIPNGKAAVYNAALKSFQQLAAQSVLHITPLTEDDVKKMLQVYFQQNTASEFFPDLDGQAYYSDVNWALLHKQADEQAAIESGAKRPAPAVQKPVQKPVAQPGKKAWAKPTEKPELKKPVPTPIVPDYKPNTAPTVSGRDGQVWKRPEKPAIQPMPEADAPKPAESKPKDAEVSDTSFVFDGGDINLDSLFNEVSEQKAKTPAEEQADTTKQFGLPFKALSPVDDASQFAPGLKPSWPAGVKAVEAVFRGMASDYYTTVDSITDPADPKLILTVAENAIYQAIHKNHTSYASLGQLLKVSAQRAEDITNRIDYKAAHVQYLMSKTYGAHGYYFAEAGR